MSAESWCKSVSAFANTLGGALIFGIADNDEIVGLENPNSDAEKISEIIKQGWIQFQNFVFDLNRTKMEKY